MANEKTVTAERAAGGAGVEEVELNFSRAWDYSGSRWAEPGSKHRGGCYAGKFPFALIIGGRVFLHNAVVKAAYIGAESAEVRYGAGRSAARYYLISEDTILGLACRTASAAPRSGSARRKRGSRRRSRPRGGPLMARSGVEETFTAAEMPTIERALEGAGVARVNPTWAGNVLVEASGSHERVEEELRGLKQVPGLRIDWDPTGGPYGAVVRSL